ncbi:MAG TPA: lipase maturation factor family protein, partial [Bryobacteraceae bacterium]|nr:lipase maturation factor family protein [Bryobacteraceae bacterium]
MRPTLTFDNQCAFCRIWVEFWRSLTGDRVEYVAAEAPIDAVRYTTSDSEYRGAGAVAHLLSGVSGYEWMLRLYGIFPGLAEFLYRLVARRRNAAYWLTRALWGERVERPTYYAATSIFSRVFAFLCLIAFASFGMQVRGLIGSSGILPISMYLRIATTQFGSSAVWRVPTIFWWAHSDFALLSITWGGVALAAIATIARAHSKWQKIIFAILFVYYLSIVSAGQIFMSYQWDLLLVETAFLAIFLRPALPRVWLFQWLLFRLMFESGMVKLLSHDPSWRNLTALSFHYETQPLPTVFAWYVRQAPLWFHQASTAMVFVIELVLPFLIFGPRRMKQVAAFGFIALQLLILITGNYTYFNLLAIALCLFLFDDAYFAGRKKPIAVTPAIPNRFVSAALV